MKSTTPWIVAGGKADEMGHCQRCGEGIPLGGAPVPLYLALAMMKAFTSHHSHCRESGINEQPPASVHEWFNGRDIGTSSMTIYSVFMHRESPHNRYAAPHDPDDFGRCYRLLKLAPEWKSRLGEVADKYPEWRGLVDNWDELTAMYESELPRGSAPILYKRMQELRGEVAA